MESFGRKILKTYEVQKKKACRRYSREYKERISTVAVQFAEAGLLEALLRREGLYSGAVIRRRLLRF